MIHIGVTASHKGLTPIQLDKIWELLAHRTFFLHHGDCIGGDAQIDALARRAPGLCGIIMHPCDIPSMRAHCQPRYPHDIVRVARPPLERDEDIVLESAFLIAAPNTMKPVLRSGTWTTVRRAQKHAREVIYVFPNGAVITEPPLEWPA